MKPRERCGHVSIASAAPTGHPAPMPIPSSARKRNKNQNVGDKPAIRLHTEYQRIEIISGFLRPIRWPANRKRSRQPVATRALR